MKFLVFLFSVFILLSCSSAQSEKNKNKSVCSDNSDCKSEEVCFYGSCFKKGDRAMGVKTVQIIGGARLNLVDGDIAPLRVQVVLSGTQEMKDAFSEEDLKKIVGPIEGETVNFSFNIDGLESTLSRKQVVTDSVGMATVDLSAVNTANQKINFNISVSTSECSPNQPCYKNYMVEVDRRSKTLQLLNDSVIFYTNSHRTLVAKVTTNGGLPYPDQDVTFKISGLSNGTVLKDQNDNTGNELTVKSDFAGIVRMNLESSELPSNFTVEVSSSSTMSKTVRVEVKERQGNGCLSNDDCIALGEAYECQQGVCVYVPIPCDIANGDADCPEKFECKEGICVEKPYVCGDEENPDIDSCRCVTDINCPQDRVCVRGRCVEQNISCTENLDCPNGLICRDGTCQPNYTECKMDINCHTLHADKCPTEDSCVCREGLCVNPCPDTEYIELSGGSGVACSDDSQCEENEVCFTEHNINKCIVKWRANYYFHLMDALPSSLQTILNGLGRVLGPISDILLGEDIDWGLPGWLSWLEETIVETVRPLIDQYIPAWAQDLIIGLNDTIEILQEMKVKVAMSFVHDPEHHSSVKGFDRWDAFYVQWHGQWTEVEPEGEEQGFQLSSAPFTGSIACQLDDDNQPVYTLYIDEHSAEFYFGRFVTAFLNGVLVPAVTHDQAHSLGEAVELYVDCRSISESIVDAVANLVGDLADGFITVETVEGLCHSGVNLLVDKVNDYINQLHFGDAQGGSDAFKFAGFATIEARNTEAKKLKDGKYTGSLNLGGEREFSADWDAQKAR